jgi:hypothetical protein
MPAQPQPPFNPVVTLTMSLDVFHSVQEILAKRPFDEICDVIMGLRSEVIPQVRRRGRRMTRNTRRRRHRNGRHRNCI